MNLFSAVIDSFTAKNKAYVDIYEHMAASGGPKRGPMAKPGSHEPIAAPAGLLHCLPGRRIVGGLVAWWAQPGWGEGGGGDLGKVALVVKTWLVFGAAFRPFGSFWKHMTFPSSKIGGHVAWWVGDGEGVSSKGQPAGDAVENGG